MFQRKSDIFFILCIFPLISIGMEDGLDPRALSIEQEVNDTNKYRVKGELIEKLKTLESDLVNRDLGTFNNQNCLDLFNISVELSTLASAFAQTNTPEKDPIRAYFEYVSSYFLIYNNLIATLKTSDNHFIIVPRQAVVAFLEGEKIERIEDVPQWRFYDIVESKEKLFSILQDVFSDKKPFAVNYLIRKMNKLKAQDLFDTQSNMFNKESCLHLFTISLVFSDLISNLNSAFEVFTGGNISKLLGERLLLMLRTRDSFYIIIPRKALDFIKKEIIVGRGYTEERKIHAWSIDETKDQLFEMLGNVYNNKLTDLKKPMHNRQENYYG